MKGTTGRWKSPIFFVWNLESLEQLKVRRQGSMYVPSKNMTLEGCLSVNHHENISVWWFQPLSKILVSWDDDSYSQYVINKKCSNHQPDIWRPRWDSQRILPLPSCKINGIHGAIADTLAWANGPAFSRKKWDCTPRMSDKSYIMTMCWAPSAWDDLLLPVHGS